MADSPSKDPKKHQGAPQSEANDSAAIGVGLGILLLLSRALFFDGKPPSHLRSFEPNFTLPSIPDLASLSLPESLPNHETVQGSGAVGL